MIVPIVLEIMDADTEPGASTTGPILLEALLQTLCQGVLFAQAVRYWDSRIEDTLRLKAFVGTLVVLSMLQTALEIYKVWFVTILDHPWSASPLKWTDILLNGVIVVLCETYLVRRCWMATNKKMWILIPLVALTLSIFIVNVFLAIEVGKATGDVTVEDPLRARTRNMPSAKFAFSYWIFGSLALDSIVTTILSIFLWRSKTGLSYLDKTLRHIIGIAWESAAVPFVSMLIAVCIYHARPAANYQLVLLFVLSTGKFYALGILRSLASRVQLRTRMKSTDLGRTSLTEWNWDQERTIVERCSISEVSPMDSSEESRPSISLSDGGISSGSDNSSDITRIGDSIQFVESPKPVK